jgi:hypothetical protein
MSARIKNHLLGLAVLLVIPAAQALGAPAPEARVERSPAFQVKDANGVSMGRLIGGGVIGTSQLSTVVGVLTTVNGQQLAIPLRIYWDPVIGPLTEKLGYAQDDVLYFEATQCFGDPLVTANFVGFSQGVVIRTASGAKMLYVLPANYAFWGKMVYSYRNSKGCFATDKYIESFPAGTPIDITSLFTEPFVVK